jgi:hypothetical protein
MDIQVRACGRTATDHSSGIWSSRHQYQQIFPHYSMGHCRTVQTLGLQLLHFVAARSDKPHGLQMSSDRCSGVENKAHGWLPVEAMLLDSGSRDMNLLKFQTSHQTHNKTFGDWHSARSSSCPSVCYTRRSTVAGVERPLVGSYANSPHNGAHHAIRRAG